MNADGARAHEVKAVAVSVGSGAVPARAARADRLRALNLGAGEPEPQRYLELHDAVFRHIRVRNDLVHHAARPGSQYDIGDGQRRRRLVRVGRRYGDEGEDEPENDGQNATSAHAWSPHGPDE